MTLKEIEEKVAKQEENTFTSKQEDEDRKVLELLVKYIKNDVKINLTENDLIEISNMYYNIFHKYNFMFVKQVAKHCDTEFDFYKILNNLDK